MHSIQSVGLPRWISDKELAALQATLYDTIWVSTVNTGSCGGSGLKNQPAMQKIGAPSLGQESHGQGSLAGYSP